MFQHATAQFRALLRAEYIDHKASLFWLPAAVGVLLVLATLVFAVPALSGHLNVNIDDHGIHANSIEDVRAHIRNTVSAEKSGEVLEALALGALMVSAAPILLAAAVAGYFILISALHGERADRSILFWKSMPVSDTRVVLAKFTAGTVLPFAVALVISLVVYAIVLGVATVLAARFGMTDVMSLWSPRTVGTTVLALVVFCLCYVLWAAPVYAWILMASAAAPRSPLLIAFLPPIVLAVMEGLFFRSSWLLNQIGMRIGGSRVGLNAGPDIDLNRDSLDATLANILHAPVDMLRALASPDLLAGLVVAGVLLWGAVELRRRKAL